MSLADGQNKIRYDVSSETSVFDFPYKYWEETDLVVVVSNKTTGLDTILVLGVDYGLIELNGNAANGGTITLVVPVSNDYVIIERIISYSTEADFKIGDGIPPSALNEEFDKGAAQRQQLSELIGRQITHPVSDAAGLVYDVPSVAVRAGKILAYDLEGNLIVVEAATSEVITGIDSTKGLLLAAGILSGKINIATLEFDGAGQINVKDLGIGTAQLAAAAITLAKMDDLGGMKLIGNITGAAATPAPVDIIDDDSMAAAAADNLSTAESIKAYIDAQVAASHLNWAIFKDIKATTVDGGSSAAAIWNVRTLAEIANNIAGVSISANQITLPIGSYFVRGSAPAHYVTGHQARIKSISGTSINVVGTSEESGASNPTYDEQTRSIVTAAFTVTAETVIEFQHYTTALRSTDGLGVAAGSGEDELYSELTIWKVAP